MDEQQNNKQEDKKKEIEDFYKSFKEAQGAFAMSDYMALDPTMNEGKQILSDAEYEIIFHIQTNLVSKSMDKDTGQVKQDCIDVYNNTYHIPIPKDQEYKTYLKSLMNFFVSKIQESTQQLNHGEKNG